MTGTDEHGNPRTIAVRLTGTHLGVIVWHSPQELERYLRGIDPQAAHALTESRCPGMQAEGEC